MLHKVKTSGSSQYLAKFIPEGNRFYKTLLNAGDLKVYHCRREVFKYVSFPCAISELSKLDLHIHKSKRYYLLKLLY